MSASTPATSERHSLYLGAARAMEIGKMDGRRICGCCDALAGAPSKEFDKFEAIFKPDDASAYWWGDCCCPRPIGLPETRGPRVLALCFMAAMVEAGDA